MCALENCVQFSSALASVLRSFVTHSTDTRALVCSRCCCCCRYHCPYRRRHHLCFCHLPCFSAPHKQSTAATVICARCDILDQFLLSDENRTSVVNCVLKKWTSLCLFAEQCMTGSLPCCLSSISQCTKVLETSIVLCALFLQHILPPVLLLLLPLLAASTTSHQPNSNSFFCLAARCPIRPPLASPQAPP